MVRKCGRGVFGEIAVMEVGVRTRSQANSVMAKKRKVNGAKLSSKKSTQRAHLERKKKNAEAERKPCSNEDRVTLQVSCCSSNNGTSEIADDDHRIQEAREGVRFVDLEDNESNEAESSAFNSRRGRREMTPSSKIREESDGLESTSKPSVGHSDRRLPATLPSESEIEEFFAAADKDIQTRFAKKYNYDIAKDTPLEGRYEWVRLKP